MDNAPELPRRARVVRVCVRVAHCLGVGLDWLVCLTRGGLRYMLTNLVQCGDMYGLVYSSERVPRCRLEGIDLNLVRFYATNIVLGLEHIHSLGLTEKHFVIDPASTRALRCIVCGGRSPQIVTVAPCDLV